ncbi:MAG: dockerin type I domain-containing protein [Oscillospiraceae bacterium]|nr:dockerin type I domain-containing protein [Oscillospiraceae bacterium]
MKNRWIALLVTVAMLASVLLAPGFPAAAEESQQVLGDINGDGQVTVTDARLLMQYLAGNTSVPGDFANGDVDGDREITVSDARCILLKLTGRIELFPAEGGPVISLPATGNESLTISLYDVKQVDNGVFMLSLKYENPEGLHLTEGSFIFKYDPAEIKNIEMDTPVKSKNSVTMGDMIIEKNETASGEVHVVFANETGLTMAGADFLHIEFELVNFYVDDIYLEFIPLHFGLEAGDGPACVTVPDENILCISYNGSSGCVVGPCISIISRNNGFKYVAYPYDVTIRGYEGADTDIVIPEQINGVTVRSIYGTALQNQPSLTSVTVPPTVTDIGYAVFSGCGGLIIICYKDTAAYRHAVQHGIPCRFIYLPGHIDGGYTLTITDARLALQYTVGKSTLTPEQLSAAAVNGDTEADGSPKVTVTDARLILQKLVDKIDRFPVES